MYLAYGMLTGDDDDNHTGAVKAKTTMWGAAITIVTADLLMSLDNVVALVGAAESTGDHAFGYTVFGILLSIPIIIFASKGLIALLEKFPAITWLGGSLIAFVGAEMLLKEAFIVEKLGTDPTDSLLAATVLATCTVGLALAKKLKPKAATTA